MYGQEMNIVTAIYDIDFSADVARDAGFVSLISAEAQKLIACSAINIFDGHAAAGRQLVVTNNTRQVRIACFAS